MPRAIPPCMSAGIPNAEIQLLGALVLDRMGFDDRPGCQRVADVYGLELALWQRDSPTYPVDYAGGRIGTTIVVWILGTQNRSQALSFVSFASPVWDRPSRTWIQRWAYNQLNHEQAAVSLVASNFAGITRVILFGHSLGGAVAYQAARKIKNDHRGIRVECFTFGEPKSRGFSQAPEPDEHPRIVYWSGSAGDWSLDPVTQLPPDAWSANALIGVGAGLFSEGQAVSKIPVHGGTPFYYGQGGQVLPSVAFQDDRLFNEDVLPVLTNFTGEAGRNHYIGTSYLPSARARYDATGATDLAAITLAPRLVRLRPGQVQQTPIGGLSMWETLRRALRRWAESNLPATFPASRYNDALLSAIDESAGRIDLQRRLYEIRSNVGEQNIVDSGAGRILAYADVLAAGQVAGVNTRAAEAAAVEAARLARIPIDSAAAIIDIRGNVAQLTRELAEVRAQLTVLRADVIRVANPETIQQAIDRATPGNFFSDFSPARRFVPFPNEPEVSLQPRGWLD